MVHSLKQYYLRFSEVQNSVLLYMAIPITLHSQTANGLVGYSSVVRGPGFASEVEVVQV